MKTWLKGTIITFIIIFVYWAIVAFVSWIIGEKCGLIGDTCYNKYNPIIAPFEKAIRGMDFMYYIATPFMSCRSTLWFGCSFERIWTLPASVILISLIVGLIYGKIKRKK